LGDGFVGLAAAHLVEALLLPVPHRQVALSIPKRLRFYFHFDRRLLADLARAAARAAASHPRLHTPPSRTRVPRPFV